MEKIVKSCLKLMLKVTNLIMGIVGIAMILYSLWMLRVWQRDNMDDAHFNSTAPSWFIYGFMGMGISVCVITGIGHIAADCANPCCLSCYTVIILFLLLSESMVLADILLNPNWEKDLPEDPTGRFNDFEDFIDSNFDICKWVGLLIVLAQGLCVLMALALRSFGQKHQIGSNYDSDEDYASQRLPLLKQPLQPNPYIVQNKHFASSIV